MDGGSPSSSHTSASASEVRVVTLVQMLNSSFRTETASEPLHPPSLVGACPTSALHSEDCGGSMQPISRGCSGCAEPQEQR